MKRHPHTPVHSSVNHSSQKAEASKRPSADDGGTKWVRHLQWSTGRSGNCDTGSTRWTPRQCAKADKAVPKGEALCEPTSHEVPRVVKHRQKVEWWLLLEGSLEGIVSWELSLGRRKSSGDDGDGRAAMGSCSLGLLFTPRGQNW